jgi:hypothetical protein
LKIEVSRVRISSTGHSWPDTMTVVVPMGGAVTGTVAVASTSWAASACRSATVMRLMARCRTPSRGMRPRVGLKPTQPLSAAGMRTLPARVGPERSLAEHHDPGIQ